MKQRQYNIWVGDILFNSFSDNAIFFPSLDVENMKYFLDNPNELQKEYPNVSEKLEKLGFPVKSDFNELEYILYKNRIETLQNKKYRLNINPTLQCNYRCWYCCVEDQKTKYE